MYGIYDEKIEGLRSNIVKLEVERNEVKEAMENLDRDYQKLICEGRGLYDPLVSSIRKSWIDLDQRETKLILRICAMEDKIEAYKQAWRDSRPKGYLQSDEDIIIKILNAGYIEGTWF